MREGPGGESQRVGPGSRSPSRSPRRPQPLGESARPRVCLDVGGTRFYSTPQTLRKSRHLKALLECTVPTSSAAACGVVQRRQLNSTADKRKKEKNEGRNSLPNELNALAGRVRDAIRHAALVSEPEDPWIEDACRFPDAPRQVARRGPALPGARGRSSTMIIPSIHKVCQARHRH